ncbi:MAG TPA: ABC transporter substrate-binding protein [Spirochaetota bacterium]|nr:ABC transporter substrate-binding protein [Spirochaetota bacterium]
MDARRLHFNWFLLVSSLAFFGPGCATEEIQIGFVGNLGGPNSEIAVCGRRAVELVFSTAPFKVRLHVADDSNTLVGGQNAVKRLAGLGCRVIIGPFMTTAGEGAVPEARKLRIPLISPTVGGIPRLSREDCFLSLNVPARIVGREIGAWCKAAGHGRVVAALDRSNTTYATAILEGVQSVVGDGVVVRIVEYSGKCRFDAGEIAGAIIRESPDAVLVAGSGADLASLVQAFGKRGREIPVYTPAWSLTGDLPASGGRFAGLVRGTTIWNPECSRSAWLHFAVQYRMLYGVAPGFVEAQAADAAGIAIEIFSTPRREDGTMSMQEISRYQGLQRQLLIDEHGVLSRPFFRLRVQKGTFVLAEGI